MRIALIAPPWTPIPPAFYGGIEQVVDLLARGLQDAGHDVSLFTTGESTCPVPKQWLLERAEGQRMGMTVPELRHVTAAYAAIGDDVDVIHDHTVAGPFFAPHVTDVPVVTTIHGPFNDELTDLYGAIARKVPVVAISHCQRATAPDVPIARVIHHGIDAVDFPLGKGDGGYLLFLGRMADDKGPHRAIQAARAAGTPILLAGKMREPWERDYFEAHVTPLLGADAEYVGEVDHERKLELLGGAKALLFPIRWPEPFGLVMLEAFACGTPVLAYREGAAPEVVEHGTTGFLCDDEDDMARAIGLLDTIDRVDCRAAVEGYFSAERMVDEHVALFEELTQD